MRNINKIQIINLFHKIFGYYHDILIKRKKNLKFYQFQPVILYRRTEHAFSILLHFFMQRNISVLKS